MLPQFTLNARIIFLLMVMFATATVCSTRDYVIMLRSANNKALHINAGGRVTAADISLAQNITIGSTDDFLTTGIYKITLYSKESGRYLCFNKHGKLVGMKNLKESCHFIESLDRGYFEFRSATDRALRVGFTRRFRPVGPNRLHRLQDLTNACFHFMKIEAEYFDQKNFPRKSLVTTKNDQPPHRRRLNGEMKKTHQQQNRLNSNQNPSISNLSNSGHNSTLSNGSSIHNGNINQKSLAAVTAESSPQPKILVRHHHNNSSIVARRRQHEREQKIRKMRKQSQQLTDGASSSSSSTSSATTLSATSSSSSLAPSALNIVAMLAASRRKRGRRKKDDVDEDVDVDVEIAASTTAQESDTSRVSPVAYLGPKDPEHRHRHMHHRQQLEPQPTPDHQLVLAATTEDRQSVTNSNGDLSPNAKLSVDGAGRTFANEYSNYYAIPALPKNLYNRMTEYVYSGRSKNTVNNINTNYDKNSNANSNNNYNNNNNNNYSNIDNNMRKHLSKSNANRKKLLQRIKNDRNKKPSIVQYRYEVSFIWFPFGIVVSRARRLKRPGIPLRKLSAVQHPFPLYRPCECYLR